MRRNGLTACGLAVAALVAGLVAVGNGQLPEPPNAIATDAPPLDGFDATIERGLAMPVTIAFTDLPLTTAIERLLRAEWIALTTSIAKNSDASWSTPRRR